LWVVDYKLNKINQPGSKEPGFLLAFTQKY
jgi:hypothetical protein